METNTAKPPVDLDNLLAKFRDGVPVDLPSGGRVTLRAFGLASRNRQLQMEEAYRKANNLGLDDPIPALVNIGNRKAVIAEMNIVDWDPTTFILGGAPLPSRDETDASKLHAANANLLLALDPVFYELSNACEALNVKAQVAQEDAAKN
jgi:hypothetical protein